MIICDTHKFAYVSLPKAATKSLFRVLRAEPYKGRKLGMHPARVPEDAVDYFTWTVARNPYDRAFSQWWSCKGCGLHRRGTRRASLGDTKRILDNLWETTPKAYYFPNLPRFLPFKPFVEWMVQVNKPGKPRGVARRIVDSQRERLEQFRADRIVYFERLLEDFNKLPFVTSPYTRLPRANMGVDKQHIVEKPSVASVFDQEVADMIWEWETPEVFERLGYERDSWKDL